MNDSATQQTMSRREYYIANPIDGQALKRLTKAGLTWLRTNQQVVNALNVFPVPDGDTGTNMVLTMQSAVQEIDESRETHVGNLVGEIAHGALMGARGNSGVILSQLWRGLARALDEYDILTGEALVKAFAEARDTAYKGVVRPVEGTILTVAKDVAAAAAEAIKLSDEPIDILEHVVKAADQSVQNTPNLLPILKEAGVVDSGGKGLYFILEGMLRWINEEDLETALINVQDLGAMDFDNTMESVEAGQDWELVIDFRPNASLNVENFYATLETMGTSIQIGEGDDMYRMHIHVPDENRTKPWDYVLTLGTITNIAIENLMAQMDEISAKAHSSDQIELLPVEPDQIAVVAVAPGTGIGRVFASLGVSALVAGGQTMNPSTQQIVEAFEDLPTNKIVILPNNKNIVMAAEAAAEISVKDVHVVKSRTVPQGFAAMMRLAPNGDFDQVVADMEAAMQDVETGEITTATRDVEIDGVKVKSGEIIALHNGKLVCSSESLLDGCLGLLEKVGADDYELITMFYGADIDRKQCDEIAAAIQEVYPDHEIEIQEGGQPHYQFIFSIE
ncbi:MAG: DAK2 domain-containing protein [Anaerolineales bacterium]|nr:DAK2 domain-containing protein [Anaerolineales bacterium]